ncbi:MAG: hypothetical protein IH845_00675 [Nanoarchaeota archaeon]|nr:hypothetical protein [Nanoarchaeota archaeon]
MIFKKRKGMIDLRELQKRGVVRIPRRDIIIPTNSDGFVELKGTTKNNPSTSENSTKPSSNNFFNFLESSPTEPAMDSFTPESSNNFSNQIDGYDKREVDEKIVNLDNKIYKLEQRLELVERKLDIENKENAGPGIIGW